MSMYGMEQKFYIGKIKEDVKGPVADKNKLPEFLLISHPTPTIKEYIFPEDKIHQLPSIMELKFLSGDNSY